MIKTWITPNEIREYSDIKVVKERNDLKLNVDIARARQYIITYTHNDFEDFDEIPEAVRTAALILAEAYAYNANISAREIKSETFDDYSYTAESSSINVGSLDLSALLDDYVRIKPNNGVTIRMRKL